MENINQPQPGTPKPLNTADRMAAGEINISKDSSKEKLKLSQPLIRQTDGTLKKRTGHQQTHKTSEQAIQSQGNQMGLHGAIYQTKLLMLFLWGGVSRRYSFRLGTEIKEANKFDDLVFEYDTDGRKEYRFLQAKHRFDESKKITTDNLLTENDGDYSLTKYFFSYTDSKKEELFKDGSIKEVTICTNIDFDFENLKCAGIEIIEIQGQDDILLVGPNTKEKKTKQPKRYRLSKKIIPLLKPKLLNYNLTRLARRLAECLLKNTSIKSHDANDIFQAYQFPLAKEVIDIKSKNFRDTFIQNDVSLSDNANNFRQLFIEELNRKSMNILSLEDINEAIKMKRIIVENKPVGLNLSKHFGKGESKDWSDIRNAIDDNEIEDFLNHLVFAVNQPNQKELGEIINTQLGKEFNFDHITAENIYNKFFMTNLNWLLSKERRRFLSYADGRDFLEAARNCMPIWFDVRKPIDSFIGRVAELKQLHKALQTGRKAAISQPVSMKGLGGIGKSELARKYIQEHSQDYDNKIIWINAESFQSLSASFRRLAQEKLKISLKNADGEEKDLKSIVEDVYRYFSEGKCLFIFDNAEKLLTQCISCCSIEAFIAPLSPNVNKPYVLITSRNQDWENIEVITLDVFSKNEATDFIRNVLDLENDLEGREVQELAKTLHCFPLALQQAVAFIKEQPVAFNNIGFGFDTKDYINSYCEEIKKLLNFKCNDNSSDLYTNTAYSTWKMANESIKSNPECGHEASKILDIIAYFDAEKIDASWFLSLVNNSEEKLESAVQLLRHYSMIDLGPEEGVLNIHRLVQQVIKIYLKDQNKEEEVLKKALILLEENSPCDGKNLDSKNKQLLQHVQLVVSHINDFSGHLLLPYVKRLKSHGDGRKWFLPAAEKVLSHAENFMSQQLVPIVEKVLSGADNFGHHQLVPIAEKVLSDVDDFRNHQLVPIVEKVLSDADNFGHHQLVPIVKKVLSDVDDFRNQLVPIVEKVLSDADNFGHHQLVPIVEKVLSDVDDFRNQLVPIVEKVLSDADNFGHHQLVPIVEKVLSDVDDFRNQLVPIVEKVLSDADDFRNQQLVPTVQKVLSQADKCLQKPKEDIEAFAKKVGGVFSRYFK